MPDIFHSCEITTSGISVRVLRDGQPHRTALGLGDFPDRAAFQAGLASLLGDHFGKDFAAIVARAAAAEQSCATAYAKRDEAERDAADAYTERDAATATARAERDAAIVERDAARAYCVESMAAAAEKIAAAHAERDALGTTEQAQAILAAREEAEADEAVIAAEQRRDAIIARKSNAQARADLPAEPAPAKR